MNFLAHAWLAGPEEAYRLGGLLGDFIKGPVPDSLPPDVAEGVRLHRAIDTYADTHPAFQASRRRVSPMRRRVAGIMVDMFYDHFLARYWADYQPGDALEDFTARQYVLLAGLGPDLPERLALMLPAMRSDDWLASYREVEAVTAALDRMANRLSRANSLPGAGEELVTNYAGFEADFRAFIADARRYTEAWRRARSTGLG
jgi:acyl carrier protein phosphodiesterase